MEGVDVPRAPRQRRRRAHRQPLRPRRHQLRHRRGVRELALGALDRHQRAGPRAVGSRDHRRGGHDERHPDVHLLQQDPGALEVGRLPSLLRGRRRDAAGRGPGDVRAQAPHRRGARRRSRLRRDPRPRLVVGRAEQERVRAGAGRAGQGADARLRVGRLRRRHGGAGRGARHRDQGGRRGGVRRPQARVRSERARRSPVVRARIGEIADRAHQVGGRRRGPLQGGDGAPPQGAAADDQGRPTEPRARDRGEPLLPQHAGAALGAERGAPAARLGLQLRLRREQLPRDTGGVRRLRGAGCAPAHGADGALRDLGALGGGALHARREARRAGRQGGHDDGGADLAERLRDVGPGAALDRGDRRRGSARQARSGARASRGAPRRGVLDAVRHPLRGGRGGGRRGVPLPRTGEPVRGHGRRRGHGAQRRARRVGRRGGPRRDGGAARRRVPAPGVHRRGAGRAGAPPDVDGVGAAGDRHGEPGTPRGAARGRRPPVERGGPQPGRRML